MTEMKLSQPIKNPFQNILGDNINLLTNNYLPIVNCVEDGKNSSQDIQNSIMLELISRAVLCCEYKGVEFPGQAHNVLMIDTDHKFKVSHWSTRHISYCPFWFVFCHCLLVGREKKEKL